MPTPKTHLGDPPELNGIRRLTWCGLWMEGRLYQITNEPGEVTCSTCLKNAEIAELKDAA